MNYCICHSGWYPRSLEAYPKQYFISQDISWHWVVKLIFLMHIVLVPADISDIHIYCCKANSTIKFIMPWVDNLVEEKFLRHPTIQSGNYVPLWFIKYSQYQNDSNNGCFLSLKPEIYLNQGYPTSNNCLTILYLIYLHTAVLYKMFFPQYADSNICPAMVMCMKDTSTGIWTWSIMFKNTY